MGGIFSSGASNPIRKIIRQFKPRNLCIIQKRNANNLRRQRDQARRENNWHIRDRNRWRWHANNNIRKLNKLKNRSQYFPKNMDPSNMKHFARDVASKAGIENIKLKNQQDSHIYTQTIMKKNRNKKIRDLDEKEENLKSKLIINDRLLMYRSTNVSILSYIYRFVYIIIIIILLVFGYKYIQSNFI